MMYERKKYLPRLIDEKIERYLRIFGAISIEGPKWCGKTWSGLRYAGSVRYLTDKSVRDLAQVDPKYIFTDERPELIDEWQIVPGIWDAVRHACDAAPEKGNFILTGSTTLEKAEQEEEVYHSGTGRIATIQMHTMSLYESGDSSGRVSLGAMLRGEFVGGNTGEVRLDDLAHLIIRGGWPENLNIPAADSAEIPRSYIESVIRHDIHERKDRKRDPEKMRMLLKSLARNESTIVSQDTLVRDIEAYADGAELIESRHTVADYLGVLDSLYLTAPQMAFSVNYRSSTRVGKSSKRHLADPSLSCALLGIREDALMNDFRTFGLMFEAMAERDLRVYADSMDATLRHFRDNSSGDEVDAIIELDDSRYIAAEIKLSSHMIPEAKQSLMEFYSKVEQKPEYMMIIVGELEAAYQDPDTGIYIVSLTALKP